MAESQADNRDTPARGPKPLPGDTQKTENR